MDKSTLIPTRLILKNCIIAAIFISLGYSSLAQTDSASIDRKPIYKLLSNGFYVNIGLAYPTFGIVNAFSSNFGFEPNIEVGNQWYFLRNETIGFGAKVSWIQAGYSSYNDINSITPTSNFDFRFLKLAPQLSIVINTNFAIDAYVEASPTLMIGGNPNSSNPGYSYTVYGLLIAPGVRLRYAQLALGFDYGSGSMWININQPASSKSTTTSTLQVPRFYLGLQF
jgi:hypothetical protein